MVTNVNVIRAEEQKLYPLSDATVWKKVVANTDPSKPYPITAETFTELRKLLKNVGSIDSYKFLETVGEIDKIAVMNDVDYEEVDLDGFELYKKLGSGFLRTAKLKQVGEDKSHKPKYKVIPAPDGDEHRVISVDDGIYSTLRMHNTDFTVLAAATCETDVTGKLPKKQEFRKTKALTVALSNAEDDDFIVVTPKIDVDDIVSDRVKYKFEIVEADRVDMDMDGIVGRLNDKRFKLLPELKTAPADAKFKDLKEGMLAFCTEDAKLYQLVDKKFVEADPSLIGKVNILVGVGEGGARKGYEFSGSSYTLISQVDDDKDLYNDTAIRYHT